MADVDVFVDWPDAPMAVGLLRRHASRGRETVTFEYDPCWLQRPDSFSIDPMLPLTPGVFRPPADTDMFATLGDSAPDTWGRMLMRRWERRMAEQQQRNVKSLQETDFLLGVSDITRLGALRFSWQADTVFQAPQPHGVPTLLALGKLLTASERNFYGNESDNDLQTIFAPGSSHGGARPKASIVDQRGRLAIAKLPKQTDEYSLERWEAIALDLATAAGITTASHRLYQVAGQSTLRGSGVLA